MSDWLRDTERQQTVPGTEQGFHKRYYLLSEDGAQNVYPSLYLRETNEETYARKGRRVSITAVFGKPGILTLSSFQYFLIFL